MVLKLNHCCREPSKIASLTLSSVFIVLFFTNFLNVLFPPDTALIKCFYVASRAYIAILFLVSAYLQKSFNYKILLFYTIFFLMALLNMMLYPQLNEYFIGTALTFLLNCSIPFTLVFFIDDIDLLYNYLIKASIVIALFAVIPSIFVLTGQMSLFGEHAVYFMGYGYSCLIPAMILFYAFLKENKYFYLILFSILVFAIVLLGSRGPLLPIGAYVIFTFFVNILKALKEKKKFKINAIIRAVLFLMVLMFSFFFVSFVFSAISNFLEVNHINSRTIDALVTGRIAVSGGRDHIYSILLNELQDDFVSLRGINAEYPIVGNYAHNIAIEILYDFGGVLGGVFLFMIVFCIVKTFLARASIDKDVTVIFMFAALCQLWNSGTLWTNHLFWIWIALFFCLAKTLPIEEKE